MKLDIQNIQAATERLRDYFELRGQIPPELDSVVSPTAQLQDLSSAQGRGLPCISSRVQASVAAADSIAYMLFNRGSAAPPGGAATFEYWSEKPVDAFVERLVITTSVDWTGSVSVAIARAAVAGFAAAPTVGLARDVRRFWPDFTQPTVQIPRCSLHSAVNIPAANAAGIWTDLRDVRVYDLPLGGVMLPPDYVVLVILDDAPGIGDETAIVFEWREFSRTANPYVP